MFNIEKQTLRTDSISFPSERQLLSNIISDCLEQLISTDGQSKNLHDLMLERLKDKMDAILDKSMLEPGFEMHLLDIIISATQRVIDENIMRNALINQELNPPYYWNELQKEIQQRILQINLSPRAVEDIKHACVDIVSKRVSKDFQAPLNRYLNFKLSQEDSAGKKGVSQHEERFNPIPAHTYVDAAVRKKIQQLKSSALEQEFWQRLRDAGVISLLETGDQKAKENLLADNCNKKEKLQQDMADKQEALIGLRNNVEHLIEELPLAQDGTSVESGVSNNVEMIEQLLALARNNDVAKEVIADVLDKIWESSENIGRSDSVLHPIIQHAVSAENFSLIAGVLAFAKKNDFLNSLLRQTLVENLSNDKNLKSLIAGVYLYDYKTNGLFDSKFLNKIFNGHQDANFDALQQKLKLFKKNMDNNIHVKLLAHADDYALAHMIGHAGVAPFGETHWPHNAADCGKNIRQELKRRYIGTGKETSPAVKKSLQANWDVVQRGEQLADFYACAAKHVYERFQEDKDLYSQKAASISKKITVAAKNMQELTDEAEHIANDLLTIHDTVNLRGEKSRNFFSRSATQHIVAETKSVLQPGIWSCIKRNIAYAKHIIFGSDLQAAKEVLKKPPTQLESHLTEENVNVIPITSEEKDKCLARAVWARARFKRTLDCLANHPEELSIMEKHLRRFENSVLIEGKEMKEHDLAAHLRHDLISNARKSWWHGGSSVAKKALEKDLRARSAAYCPV